MNPSIQLKPTTSSLFIAFVLLGLEVLLNEFLKARRQIDVQQKQIYALTAGLQRVSTQLELNKLAQQTVKNND